MGISSKCFLLVTCVTIVRAATWLPSVHTLTPQAGWDLAVTKSRKAVKFTQPDTTVLQAERPKYSTDSASLIAASHVVALNFQEICAANGGWADKVEQAATDTVWLTTLQKDTAQEGWNLAVLMARKAVKTTQPDVDVLKAGRPVYSHHADSLISASEIIAINFQTVAAANNYWEGSQPDASTDPEPWLKTLQFASEQEGWAMAVNMSRKGVGTTQTNSSVLHSQRPVYSANADSLIHASQVIALNYQTVALANKYWQAKLKNDDAAWLKTLQTPTAYEGFNLAVTMSRKGVGVTQPDGAVKATLRPVYSKSAKSLIACSQVVAINFQTVAARNAYWGNTVDEVKGINGVTVENTWMLTLKTATAAEGWDLAVMIARKAVGKTQTDKTVKDAGRLVYANDPTMLIAASQVIAINYHTVATANAFWKNEANNEYWRKWRNDTMGYPVSTNEAWLPDLQTDYAYTGWELAVNMSRKGVGTTQRDKAVLQSLRPAYSTSATSLIAASQVVGMNYEIVAAANGYWADAMCAIDGQGCDPTEPPPVGSGASRTTSSLPYYHISDAFVWQWQ